MDTITATRDERFDRFVMNTINTKRHDTFWCMAVGFDLYPQVHEYCEALGDSYEVASLEQDSMGKLILNYCSDKWEERQEKKNDAKWAKLVRKVARRGSYADASEIKVRAKEGKASYHFDTAFGCMGLVAEILQHKGVSMENPVVLNLLNRLPQVKDEKGRDSAVQYQLPESEADNFLEAGYELYQLKTLWNSKIPELWEIFERCLPLAIDRASYHRRGRAPLVPAGFMPEVRARFGICNVNGVPMGADGSGWYDPHHPLMLAIIAEYGPVVLQGTMINPTTGHFAKGIWYPMEGMNDGLPEHERAPIMVDHLQVKGEKKGVHKELARLDPHGLKGGRVMLDGCFFGFMKAKTTMGKVSGCFELGENIGPNPVYYQYGDKDPQYIRDKIRVTKIFRELTQRSVDAIGEKGPQGLLGRACQDDPHLARFAEFLGLVNAQGAGINPLSIPLMESKLRESLSRRMWAPTNGAGIRGQYPIVIIDDTLKPGTCVIAGYKPGSEIASWRFPTVLPQALLKLRVAKGKQHHRVDGKIVRNAIYMHSHDIVTCQQGDDDGDEVGVTDDPLVRELFDYKLDRGIYHIEPVGQKMTYAANSPEGRAYLRIDPMGPVGKITIWRACQLAVGNYDLARAFSVLIQEAIDMQKNIVRMTSPYAAANLDNWYQDINGHYHIHYRCKGGDCLCKEFTREDREYNKHVKTQNERTYLDRKSERRSVRKIALTTPYLQSRTCPNATKGYLTSNWHKEEAGFDIDVVAEVHKEGLMAAGCIKYMRDEVVAGWPLGWRNQVKIVELDNGEQGETKLRKAVALNNWLPWRVKQDSDHSNWVHFSHDVARARWQSWKDSFAPSEEVPTKDVLPEILKRLGVHIQPLNITWQDYAVKPNRQASRPLRERAGIVEYGRKMRNLKSAGTQAEGAEHGPVDEQARLAKVDLIRSELELRLSKLNAQELLTIWIMELTPAWWYKRHKQSRKYVTDLDDVPHGQKFYQANRPNYAFMAVCSQHSGIMKALGLETTEACDYMTEDRMKSRVQWMRLQDRPYEALTKIIRGDKGHQKHHDGNGEPLHLSECSTCCARLETSLIRSIRSDKQAKEQEATKQLVSALNKMEHVQIVDSKDILVAPAIPASAQVIPNFDDDPYA